MWYGNRRYHFIGQGPLTFVFLVFISYFRIRNLFVNIITFSMINTNKIYLLKFFLISNNNICIFMDCHMCLGVTGTRTASSCMVFHWQLALSACRSFSFLLGRLLVRLLLDAWSSLWISTASIICFFKKKKKIEFLVDIVFFC